MIALKSSETTLKPCPFCGGEAEVNQTYDIDTNEVDGYFIICRNKDCTAWPETAEYLTEAEAIEAWNTRADNYKPAAEYWQRMYEDTMHEILAERTCEIDCEVDDNLEYPIWIFELSCGHSFDATTKDPPNYCPECGAKVVKE